MSTMAANGWGCEKCWRLKLLLYPTIRSYKKAKTFPNQPNNQQFFTPLVTRSVNTRPNLLIFYWAGLFPKPLMKQMRFSLSYQPVVLEKEARSPVLKNISCVSLSMQRNL
jgi:hypothetical protein